MERPGDTDPELVPEHDQPRLVPGQLLPAYRYVPGRMPHPSQNPTDHFRYEGEPVPSPLDPRRWQENGWYLYSCDLYNTGFFWEAHEALEDLWRTTGKDTMERHLLQGVIQVSAAHLKRYLGQHDATRPLVDRALGHLARIQSEEPFAGLVVPTFAKSVDRYFSGNDPAFPALCLKVD